MTSDPPRRRASARRSAGPAVVAAVCLAASLGAVPPAESAGAGTAAGRWLGSRTASGRAVYRIDPTRLPGTPGFGAGSWVRVLRGSGPVEVTRTRTRRAAWIVSKYGTYDSDAQAAAVEVALDALLHGGGYRLDGSGTRRRLRASGASESILTLARYMLDHSTLLAGHYRVRVDVTGAPAGDQVRVGVTVTTEGTGEPIAHLPVEVRYDGRSRSRTTDDAGAVAVTSQASAPGPHPVTVVVGRVPTDRLFVRSPTRKGASRVVVAGRKTRLTRHAVLAVQARPEVSLSAPAVRLLTQPVPGTIRVSGGYPAARTAAVRLHGPFATRGEATCEAGTEAATGSVEVTGDGDYAVPVLRATEPGVYRWSVQLAANDFNLGAEQCAERIVLKTVPDLGVSAVEGQAAVSAPARAKVAVAGLPTAYSDDVVVRLFGPFPTKGDARCVDAREVKRRTVAVVAPATTGRTDPVRLDRPGVYAWQAVLPSAMLSTRVVTPCGAGGSFLTVR